MALPRPRLIPLGVSAALPHMDGVNSYLAVARSERFWLVDCAGDPIQRLQMAGLDPLAVEGVFITHFHPDHVYGLPAFALGLYLLHGDLSWSHSIPICARAEVLTQVRGLLGQFDSQGWPNALPFEFREIDSVVGSPVAETASFVVTAGPACHSIPSLAVRFGLPDSDRSLVYSGDTAPCDGVTALATGATFLVHEATGEGYGHSDAWSAGEVAARAGAERLALIHYDTAPEVSCQIQARAAEAFGKPVTLLQALQCYDW